MISIDVKEQIERTRIAFARTEIESAFTFLKSVQDATTLPNARQFVAMASKARRIALKFLASGLESKEEERHLRQQVRMVFKGIRAVELQKYSAVSSICRPPSTP